MIGFQVVENFQPSFFIEMKRYCISIASHNVYVFLSEDLGFIKPNVVAGFIHSMLTHMSILDIAHS